LCAPYPGSRRSGGVWNVRGRFRRIRWTSGLRESTDGAGRNWFATRATAGRQWFILRIQAAAPKAIPSIYFGAPAIIAAATSPGMLAPAIIAAAIMVPRVRLIEESIQAGATRPNKRWSFARNR